MPYGTDHPRSRGVDWHNFGIRVNSGGSSPLARGRHGVRPGVSAPRWIIPARAGSTTSSSRSLMASTDHPRSRGVDPLSTSTPSRRAGSSPLARGRPQGTRALLVPPGIIPARAGSTGHRPGAAHVRSGSSPLARGRRRCGRDFRCPGWDHPRSRGVDYSRVCFSPFLPDHPRSRGVDGWAQRSP